MPAASARTATRERSLTGAAPDESPQREHRVVSVPRFAARCLTRKSRLYSEKHSLRNQRLKVALLFVAHGRPNAADVHRVAATAACTFGRPITAASDSVGGCSSTH